MCFIAFICLTDCSTQVTHSIVLSVAKPSNAGKIWIFTPSLTKVRLPGFLITFGLMNKAQLPVRVKTMRKHRAGGGQTAKLKHLNRQDGPRWSFIVVDITSGWFKGRRLVTVPKSVSKRPGYLWLQRCRVEVAFMRSQLGGGGVRHRSPDCKCLNP